MNKNELNFGQAMLTAVCTVTLSLIVGLCVYEYQMSKVRQQLENIKTVSETVESSSNMSLQTEPPMDGTDTNAAPNVAAPTSSDRMEIERLYIKSSHRKHNPETDCIVHGFDEVTNGKCYKCISEMSNNSNEE